MFAQVAVFPALMEQWLNKCCKRELWLVAVARRARSCQRCAASSWTSARPTTCWRWRRGPSPTTWTCRPSAPAGSSPRTAPSKPSATASWSATWPPEPARTWPNSALRYNTQHLLQGRFRYLILVNSNGVCHVRWPDILEPKRLHAV